MSFRRWQKLIAARIEYVVVFDVPGDAHRRRFDRLDVPPAIMIT
jgi:hypothetical protein